MTVTPSFIKPTRPKELNDKILSTPPGKEDEIADHVKEHVSNGSSYNKDI